MKIKAFSPLLAGYETEAEFTTDHPASRYGQPVFVLDNGEALGTADVALADYRLLEATPEERAALASAGYDLPDATPEERAALASAGYDLPDATPEECADLARRQAEAIRRGCWTCWA